MIFQSLKKFRAKASFKLFICLTEVHLRKIGIRKKLCYRPTVYGNITKKNIHAIGTNNMTPKTSKDLMIRKAPTSKLEMPKRKKSISEDESITLPVNHQTKLDFYQTQLKQLELVIIFNQHYHSYNVLKTSPIKYQPSTTQITEPECLNTSPANRDI